MPPVLVPFVAALDSPNVNADVLFVVLAQFHTWPVLLPLAIVLDPVAAAIPFSTTELAEGAAQVSTPLALMAFANVLAPQELPANGVRICNWAKANELFRTARINRTRSDFLTMMLSPI